MKKLKVLTVDRANGDGYWIAGLFDSDEELFKYIELHFFDESDYEIEEVAYQLDLRCLANGEYAYKVIVANPTTFIIDQILAPETYNGPLVDDNPKYPLTLILAAKNASDLKGKCLEMMATLAR